MWIRIVLLILILSAVVLFACASERRTSEDTLEVAPEEIITISFVNSIQTADVWIIPDTEKNRKTSVWGTADLKNAEPEKEYSVPIQRNDGDTYLLRMIDKDHTYYESKSIMLKEGYSVIVYCSEKSNLDIRLAVYNENEEESENISLFHAAL